MGCDYVSCVRTWLAKFDHHGDIAAVEPASVAQSQAAASTPSEAQSLAQAASSLQESTKTLVQQVAAMTQAERLQARGALVKVWREKAAPWKKGRDFRGIIASECLFGVDDFGAGRTGLFSGALCVCLQFEDTLFF